MSLRGGFCVDGLMDLTGCPTYLHMISSESVRAAIRSGEFWEMLVANLDKGNLVCASTPGEVRGAAPAPGGGGPHGLVPGHAYTILHAVEVSGNLLLNIRNPYVRANEASAREGGVGGGAQEKEFVGGGAREKEVERKRRIVRELAHYSRPVCSHKRMRSLGRRSR
jgi:hypothetical protein